MRLTVLTTAKTIILDYYGPNGIVVEPTHGYKAPHAHRDTPKRPHRARFPRMVFSMSHGGMIPVRKPFNGYRP